ncbi:ABC-type polysaccharide/polyol phosphate export system, permease component [Leptolyngbyaceae cyanobacterium JSC-12]|nr:ABC-type polysaccharide/polyol phosphate export system, permease component [Leptolyngbyaceae cyanobacterium JSC-12]
MIPIFFAELKRQWIQQRRYALDSIAGILGIAVAFYGFFLTTKYAAGSAAQFGDRLDSIVVGYALWSLVTFIIADIAGGLQQEAFTGTLEQIFLSPFSPAKIFLTRALARLTVILVQILGILLILMTITGRFLSFTPTLLLPLVTVILGAFGIALAMGGLSLLIKQVQQILGFLPFGLFLAMLVPVETWEMPARLFGWLLPMTPGAGVLRELMARNQALNWGELAIAFLNGGIYFAIGLMLFKQAEHIAKLRGRLGGY